MNPLQVIRDRWHPLHRLRRMPWFRDGLQRYADFAIPVPVGLAAPIYLRLFTHASIILLHAEQERAIRRLFLSLLATLPPRPVIYDIGANVGLYTWTAASARPDATVVAVEPDPRNFDLLTMTLRLWTRRARACHVHLARQAVSDSRGIAPFHRDPITSATGSLEDTQVFIRHCFGVEPATTQVETTTIDSLASTHGPPDILKIDVEGHEHRAIAGAMDVLARGRPPVLFESFSHIHEIRPALEQLGYRLHDAETMGDPTPRTTNYLAIAHPPATDPSQPRRGGAAEQRLGRRSPQN